MDNNILLTPVSLDQLETLFRTWLRSELEDHPLQPVPDKLLKPVEAAELLKVTLPTLHDWTKKGKLTAHYIERRKFYKYSEIIDALQPTETPKK